MITHAAVERYSKWVRARARVIPNPLKLPNDARIKREGHTLTAVGRLVHQKGFDLLLEAFAPLAEKFPEWTLSIWGEGPELAELEAQRDRLGLKDRVRFCGLSARPGAWRESADAFVLSSRYEGWGNVVAEAMAAHIPVVSFDCDFGPSNLISNEVNGLLVPNGDVPALREALSRLMADRDLRDRLACAGAQSVKVYTVENIAAEWDDAIEAAIRRRLL
jgi:glycosyltransferase involved in cell wall biosynthesis